MHSQARIREALQGNAWDEEKQSAVVRGALSIYSHDPVSAEDPARLQTVLAMPALHAVAAFFWSQIWESLP